MVCQPSWRGKEFGAAICVAEWGSLLLPGYGFNDCTPIQGDGPALPVVWKDKKALPHGIIRIELELVRAGVLGFRAVEDAVRQRAR
jgi:hypothetical protein